MWNTDQGTTSASEIAVIFGYTFYFPITYGVCKKRKYSNRMSEKKKIPDPDSEQNFYFHKNFVERHQIWWIFLAYKK